MAETVITDIRRVKQNTRAGAAEPGDPKVEEDRRHFATTSRWASILDASLIRDLAAALDLYAAPDAATVRIVEEQGRPVRLVAEWSVPLERGPA